MPDNCMQFTPLPCPSCGAEPGSPGPDGGQGCENGSASVVRLCDITPDDCVPFLRHISYSCEGQPTAAVDTTLDGLTPYTPTGVVGDCADCATSPHDQSPPEPCEPAAMCPGFAGLTGPETWQIPPGAESVHLSVVCGPVTVYPCAGATDGVVINECGASFQWAATGTCCHPGELCPGLRIDVPECAAAYVTWLAPGCAPDQTTGQAQTP